MRLILVSAMTTASSCGIAPPESEVPAPRGTTLTFSSRQSRMTRATSSVERGSATASGSRR